MLPAKHVGGDFFDFFTLNEDKIAFSIADVSGKGVPAALFMTMTRGLLRALGQKNESPEKCLIQLNELLSSENDSSMFVTAFYGIYNTSTGELVYCNGGHNPPYLLTSKEGPKQIARCEGLALGIMPNSDMFKEKTIQLNPTDRFLLYTDGVTEAMNIEHNLFTEDRLEHSLKDNFDKPLPEFVHTIVSDVKTFAGAHEQSDDITLLVIERK
jgi:phosphoserine phosphatase RsbU/P